MDVAACARRFESLPSTTGGRPWLAMVLIASLAWGCADETSEVGAEDGGASSWVEVGNTPQHILHFGFDGAGNAVMLAGGLSAGAHTSTLRDRGEGFERLRLGVESHIRRIYEHRGANGELLVRHELVSPIGGSTHATINRLRPEDEGITSHRYVIADKVKNRWNILWSDTRDRMYFLGIYEGDEVLWITFQFHSETRPLTEKPWTLLPGSMARALVNFDGSLWLSIPGSGIWRVSADGESASHVLRCPNADLFLVCDGTPSGISLLGHAEGHAWIVLPNRFALIDSTGTLLGELAASPSDEFPIPDALRVADARDGSVYLHARTALSPDAPGMLFKGDLSAGWQPVFALDAGYVYRLSPEKRYLYRWQDRPLRPIERRKL